MEREIFTGNRITGCSIAGFLSAAAGWSHGDRIPLSEFTEQLLRQGTGAICYQLRSQSSLSPFNAERLFGGTEAEKPAHFVPLPRHPVFQQSCQKCQQALPASPGAGPHARESPGCAGHSAQPVPITSREVQRWVPRSRPPARWSIRPEAAPGKHPSVQEVGGRYQALPIPHYSPLAPPPARLTQPGSFWLSFCALTFFSSSRASLSCARSEEVITWRWWGKSLGLPRSHQEEMLNSGWEVAPDYF